MSSDNNPERDAFDELIEASAPTHDVEPAPPMSETEVVSPPEQVAPAPSLPHLVSRLRNFMVRMVALRDDLSRINKNADVLPDQCRAALAAIASGQRIPNDNPDDRAYLRWTQAPTAKLLGWRSMAIEEINGQVGIADKAIMSLQTLDAFDKPPLASWSNLPAHLLARSINAHAHRIFSGAVVNMQPRSR